MNPIPIAIPVRNGLAYTRACIASLRAQDTPVSVWVIDNASEDGTAEWLRAQPDVMTTRHLTPLSVAASWNYALRTLFAYRDVDRVVLVNNDTVFRADFIRSLAEADLPFATGVGVATVEQMNEPFVRADRERPDFSAYMIRRDCWGRVGLFDEGYATGFYEDNDFHARAWRKGVHLTCIGIPFWHAGSATLKNADDALRQEITAAAAKNKQRFVEKWGCDPASEAAYDELFSLDRFGVDGGE